MSETEPIPPTSSVTALRIPIIKKGEYDLWSMKMRQVSMKNEGTAQVHEGTARRYCSKVLLLFESTAHYAQSTARCESTAVMFEVEYSQCDVISYLKVVVGF
ncbi:hypothetical protein Tco_0540038 [Tanacetum coccineum]